MLHCASIPMLFKISWQRISCTLSESHHVLQPLWSILYPILKHILFDFACSTFIFCFDGRKWHREQEWQSHRIRGVLLEDDESKEREEAVEEMKRGGMSFNRLLFIYRIWRFKYQENKAIVFAFGFQMKERKTCITASINSSQTREILEFEFTSALFDTTSKKQRK